MIQESLCDHVIRMPLRVDGPEQPGADEWNPTSLEGREGVAGSGCRHARAHDDGPGPGPGVGHRRIRRLAAVVEGAQCANGCESPYDLDTRSNNLRSDRKPSSPGSLIREGGRQPLDPIALAYSAALPGSFDCPS